MPFAQVLSAEHSASNKVRSPRAPESSPVNLTGAGQSLMGRVSWKRPKSTHWRPFLDTSTSCAMSAGFCEIAHIVRVTNANKNVSFFGSQQLFVF